MVIKCKNCGKLYTTANQDNCPKCKGKGREMIPTYFPGTRVLVFDSRLYVDDKKTPINETLNMATVLCWYCQVSQSYGKYENLIDVEFDHRPGQTSHAHIATAVRVVNTTDQAERAVREIATNAKLNEDQEFLLRKKLFQEGVAR